ncbi:hypothetical protein FA10DRAFT_297692 [Acaromyces ingoldii]|uniref:Amidohydrolase-related domain-containing protein n=1 Tax=Acaromyces ingoldii TaxID=215250 RepID=A0A316YBU5_9BASI|nr:hypothetical protein FA10DRAFT_297692 [Acaromyces ingoldii]PWN86729.1 hypothetical protein FA10DRAFT_297692 [Acaromyces ingoldii]
MSTAITNVRLFDGLEVHEKATVIFEDGKIKEVRLAKDQEVKADTVLDGRGKTLLPGLIDAHVHAKSPALEQNMLFGVTTALDMFSFPEWMNDLRKQAASRFDVSDIRSASCGGTVLNGHPTMLIGKYFPTQFPVVASVAEVGPFVAKRVKEGADYIKFIIDSGSQFSHSHPSVDEDMAKTFVQEAHKHGKMAICHALDANSAKIAVRAGVDGLIHVFYDVASDDEAVQMIADAKIWVCTTIVTLGALAGESTGNNVAEDNRVMNILPPKLHNNLTCCWGPKRSPASTENALSITRALHKAGVPILAGTDACGIVGLGAVYGASLHGELRYLVEAGLTPLEALRSATSIPANKFSLRDRGVIKTGLNADLLLVRGNPIEDIHDIMEIDSVWRAGHLLDRKKTQADILSIVGTE